MFINQPMPWKQEVVVNLLGPTQYGRGTFLENHFHLSHSEAWEYRRRVLAAMEPRPLGRPGKTASSQCTEPCSRCKEKDAELAALRDRHAAEERKRREHLILQAAVLPVSTESIPTLEAAAFGSESSPETVRTFIGRAGVRARQLMESFPWEEKIRQLAVDELFAGKTPILNGVEPRSMAVPFLQCGPDRTGDTWTEVLKPFPNLEEVASDQGTGILAALRTLQVASQGDIWHANQELKRCLGALERDACRGMREEYAAQRDLERRVRQGRRTKRAERRYRKARTQTAKAIDRFDRAYAAKPLLEQAVAPFDNQGHWLSAGVSQGLIEDAMGILQKLEAPYRRKVANAFDPARILTFKVLLESSLLVSPTQSVLSPEARIDLVANLARPRPAEPIAELPWMLSRVVEQKIAADFSSWPQERERIQDRLEHLFRGSSWSESFNSIVRVAQQVKKHLGENFLWLLALAHNATPFRGGKRRGKSPLEILGITTPPGTWLDWVRPQ